ncbi:HNH endonuclease [Salmonella enterica]|nr:HNH endonuclease [Salmonella enterica]
MLSENAKDIAGYEGKYAITTDGRVYSHSRVDTRGKLRKGRWLKPREHGGGYLQVSLCDKGKVKQRYIHRLVAITFIDNPRSHPQVNHINGIKTDNNTSNLEWVTPSQNMLHAHESGLQVAIKGEGHYRAKLTTEQVSEIRSCKSMSRSDMARKYGVDPSQISNIINNKRWVI